jgi:hypothetical protein
MPDEAPVISASFRGELVDAGKSHPWKRTIDPREMHGADMLFVPIEAAQVAELHPDHTTSRCKKETPAEKAVPMACG